MKKVAFSSKSGADGGNRTHMQLLATDFESVPSTSFSTSANIILQYNITSILNCLVKFAFFLKMWYNKVTNGFKI
mgnify:CR=1 FL=1